MGKVPNVRESRSLRKRLVSILCRRFGIFRSSSPTHKKDSISSVATLARQSFDLDAGVPVHCVRRRPLAPSRRSANRKGAPRKEVWPPRSATPRMRRAFHAHLAIRDRSFSRRSPRRFSRSLDVFSPPPSSCRSRWTASTPRSPATSGPLWTPFGNTATTRPGSALTSLTICWSG